MSHPARVAILTTLAADGTGSPRSTANAAAISISVCAYHMQELTTSGLVHLRNTRQVRGAVEHFYELTRDGQAAIRAIDAVLALAPKPHRVSARTTNSKALRRATTESL